MRDRAWFYLARIGYQRGYYERALANLHHVQSPLPGKLEPERRLLQANVLMALSRFGDAARELSQWTDTTGWSQYARFNLGVALVRSGDVAQGSAYLEQVGTLVPRNDEQAALRDRANLALGFALLQQQGGDAAVAALNRVRLDGPFTNRALLALGWAETNANRPDRALVPAYALLAVVGACGGFFIVPLNALLQERGRETVGAGHAIAIQNLGENSAMLAMLGLYTVALGAGTPVLWIAPLFGLGLSAAIAALWISRRRARAR